MILAACSGCHGVFTHSNTVNFNAVCGGVTFTRIVPNNKLSGSLYRKVANSPPCGGVMPPSTTGLSAAQLKIIRAWIRNGALNN